MELVDYIREYCTFLQKRDYVYSLQKEGLELFNQFIHKYSKYKEADELTLEMIEFFLLAWVPRNKKYLTEEEAYNIVYAIEDLYCYINKNDLEIESTPIVLEQYGKEYMRLYGAIQIVHEIVGDPVISVKPLVISLENYKSYQSKQRKKDAMCLYETGCFQIEEVSSEGYVVFKKINKDKTYKVLFTPHLLSYLKKGDLLQLTLKKKVFFIYWEICQIKGYYLPEAEKYVANQCLLGE